MDFSALEGKVITARGPVAPDKLGAVMMHEHLHADWSQKDEVPFDEGKWPMLEKYVVPSLKKLKQHGCFGLVDMTRPPERAAPWVYEKISELADFHVVLCTGFYREIELGKYWARKVEDQIWPFVRDSSLEELEEFCVREFEEGLHASGVRPGVLKVASSSAQLTETETKAIRAVARAQKRTGLLIGTHATGAESFMAQLDLLESEGVNPERVLLGHTESALISAWPKVRECMKRGANFAMTNLRMDVADDTRRGWADAIIRAFDEGFGSHLSLGLDWAFNVGYIEYMADPQWRPHQGDSNMLAPCTFMPPPAFVYLFERTIPRFKEMGVTDQMLRTMLIENPQRIIPVRKP